MSTDPLHIVCPHCHTTNRVSAAQRSQAPNCGKCHQPLFTGHPVALDEAGFAKHVSRSDLPVLMTAKDAVKCAPFAGERCYSVPIRTELPEAFWVMLLDRLRDEADAEALDVVVGVVQRIDLELAAVAAAGAATGSSKPARRRTLSSATANRSLLTGFSR